MDLKPPKYGIKFLRWFCREDFLDEIEGDLIELYARQKESNTTKAKWQFCWQVLRHFRPDFIRKDLLFPKIIYYTMIKYNLKIAIRRILKQPVISAINLSGLVMGITCFIFISLWIQNQRSIDNFHASGDRLYNIYQTIESEGRIDGNFSTPLKFEDDRFFVLLEGVDQTVPQIKRINHYATGYELPWGHPETLQFGKRTHKFKGARASADFFEMFDFQVLAGQPKTALQDLSSIAISKHIAELFFEKPSDAIGQILKYENDLSLQVSAVFDNVPTTSSLQFDFLINWDLHEERLGGWASHFVLTTIELEQNANVQSVTKGINTHLETHRKPDGLTVRLGLQPYNERYLVSNFVNGIPTKGRITYLRIFTGVALFILLIACINFMNLSIAGHLKKAKEIGVRKVIGSSKSKLVGQFFSESLVLSLTATVVSITLVFLLIEPFNALTGKQIALPFSNPIIPLLCLIFSLLVGLVAGSYPAILLSSIKPIKALGKDFRFGKSSRRFRKGLSIFQFSLSIFLLIATIVITKQINYLKTSHLGYDRANLIYIPIEGEMVQQSTYQLFKDRALNMRGVNMIDRSSEAPHAMGFVVTDPIDWQGKSEEEVVGFKPASVGYDFIDIMGLQIIEGRNFSRGVATDSAHAFLINEEALKQIGMEDPIGKSISAWNKKGQIIGVLKDYHTHSLHEPILPVIIDVKEYEGFGVIIVRYEPGQVEEALANIEEIYTELNPNYPLDYQFVDQEYESLYRSEMMVGRLSRLFAFLAILISVLGLFGLAMFAVRQRLKEISIRKVLGASSLQVLYLLSRDFIWLISIAFVLAAPVAAYFMQKWLSKFAYTIDLSWWIFVAAGLISLVFGLMTISSQTLRTAIANPANILRAD